MLQGICLVVSNLSCTNRVNGGASCYGKTAREDRRCVAAGMELTRSTPHRPAPPETFTKLPLSTPHNCLLDHTSGYFSFPGSPTPQAVWGCIEGGGGTCKTTSEPFQRLVLPSSFGLDSCPEVRKHDSRYLVTFLVERLTLETQNTTLLFPNSTNLGIYHLQVTRYRPGQQNFTKWQRFTFQRRRPAISKAKL